MVRSRSAKLKTPHVVPVPSPHHSLLDSLRGPDAVIAAELRPPRAELTRSRGHGRLDRHVPRRSAADAERHVRVPHRQRRRAPPRKTTSGISSRTSAPTCRASASSRSSRAKHPLDYCLSYAERAWQHGLPGARGARRRQDRRRPALGRACVAAAPDAFARTIAALALGGWANPHADAERAGRLSRCDRHFTAEFYLTQVVSHHHAAAGRAVRPRAPSGRGLHDARAVRRLLLPQREPADAGGAASSFCRCRSRS